MLLLAPPRKVMNSWRSEYLITLARVGSFVEQMKITSVLSGNKVVLSKSMTKYATENVLSPYIQFGQQQPLGIREHLWGNLCTARALRATFRLCSP